MAKSRRHPVHFSLVAMLCIEGCTAPRPERMMAVTVVDGTQSGTASPLVRAVAIGAAIGSEEYTVGSDRFSVNGQELREAIRLSFQRAGYLAPDDKPARFILDVAMIWLEPPAYGPTDPASATALIRYRLYGREKGTTVFEDLLTTSCALGGIGRLRSAVECAVQRNIGAFLYAVRASGEPARQP